MMQKLSILFAVLAVACAIPFERSLDESWENYKKTYNKSYTQLEEPARRLIWEQNYGKIVRHNVEASLGKHSFKLGLNHLTDQAVEEVANLLNGYVSSKRFNHAQSTFIAPSNIVLPDEVDWTKEGLVTPVKDQGQCGSCWAFSSTGSVEGQHKKKTGTLVALSEQQLMDCSTDEGNQGCDGGLMDNAFEYIKENGGIDTEESYPYEGVQGKCRFKKSGIGATVSGFVDIPSGDEQALLEAVATIGPVSVAIDASQFSFQLYHDGVYDERSCSSSLLDHGVLVVGYGTENGKDYWLVKNSWGTTWGLQGYIKMSRNKDNQCGIATEASYPLV